MTEMKCKICGITINKSIGHLCFECHLSKNLPTAIKKQPWVYSRSFRKVEPSRTDFDEDLAMAITSMSGEISKDKTVIVLKVGNKSKQVPLTVENIDRLAHKSGILVGKWLVYRNKSEIDDVWKTIAKATFNGDLGISAKVSTAMQTGSRHVICVYTGNYLDLKDVMKVRKKLMLMGFTERLCYKPDIYTYLGIYYQTAPLSPCRYRN